MQLGEEKRLDYVEDQIDLSKNTIKIFQYISQLYEKEMELMNKCGIFVSLEAGALLVKESGL